MVEWHTTSTVCGQLMVIVNWGRASTSSDDVPAFEGDRNVKSATVLLVPLYAFFKCCPSSSKNVQSAANCQVNSTGAAFSDKVEVLNCACSSSVGDRNRAPLREGFHKVRVDALLKSFVVCRMDEEFATVRLQHRDVTLSDLKLCHSLPLVHSHEPGVALSPTAQVNHEFGCIVVEGSEHFLELFNRELSVREQK